MRKTFVVALIALLVMLAFASCGDILTGEKPEYTADGQRLVTLKVSTGETTGNSRSLTNLIAKAKADYMEVIFHDTTTDKYYQGADYIGTLSIKIPAKTYLATDAVLLIGRKSDGTLLAIGTLDSGSLIISADTDTIEFNVTSLTTELNANASPSSFVIEASSVAADFSSSIVSLTKWDGGPCFQVNTDQPDIKASLTISGFGSNAALIKEDTGTGTEVIFKAIGSAALPSITVLPAAIDPVAFSTGAAKVSFKFTTPVDSDFPVVSGPIEAKYNISFKIPVKGFDENNSDFLTWTILSGIKTGTDLDGGEKNGVALLVTDSATEWAEGNIVIKTW